MNEIPIGSRGTFELVVGPDHLANRFKDELARGVGHAGDDPGDGERGAERDQATP